jgi:hypothetical protein
MSWESESFTTKIKRRSEGAEEKKWRRQREKVKARERGKRGNFQKVRKRKSAL